MTFRVDPSRLDLAVEFKANIYGRHSGDLQRILNAFRSEPQAGQYVLIRRGPARSLGAGRIRSAARATAAATRARSSQTTAEAEWAVFKLRWKRHTGQDLALD